MSNLPPGWDLDYDGNRWFYKYRSSGLIQYTFPKEGDEFPDFVDASAPAPTLAPEEKLESQQQVRRRGDTGAGNGRKPKSSGMSATGGPVSTTWDDDDDGDYAYFQPENFMFLGPGAYTDVSPLVDEDETEGSAGRAKGKDVSPSGSKATPDAVSDRVMSPPVSSISTPQTSKAEPVVEHAVLAVDSTPPTIATPAEFQADQAPSPEVPMLDSRERPHELPEAPSFNPVGIMAEMPTEATAVAHIELHPDPVEMGDNTVLAPIEAFYLNSGIAELPTQNSPVERKEAEPAPQRRRATSQPLQRVYPFQPTEDDDPDRPPTPLGPSPAPTPSPQPPTDAISQGQNRSVTPFTPSTGPTPVSTPPAQPKADTATPVVQKSKPDAQSRPTSPQEPFRITRKPTNAGSKPPFRPYTPDAEPAKAEPGSSDGQDPVRANTPSTTATAQDPSRSGQADTSSMPALPTDHPQPATAAAGFEQNSTSQVTPHFLAQAPSLATESPNTPPPVPKKDAPGALPQIFQQRPHSNSLPGSLRPSGPPGTPGAAQQFQGVPLSLQPGNPAPLPLAVPGKGKGKTRASPSPLGFGKRSVTQPTHAPSQSAPGPVVVSPPDPPSGSTVSEQPVSTPSPLETRGSSPRGASGSSPQSQVTSAGLSPAVHPLPVPGASSNGQGQAQHQKVPSTVSLGNNNNAQQGAPAQSQPHQPRAAGSYFPPQPPGGVLAPSQVAPPVEARGEGRTPPPADASSPGRSANAQRPSSGSPPRGSQASKPFSSAYQTQPKPQPAPHVSPLSAQQAAPRPQLHHPGPPLPPKQALSQPEPLQDSALGHFLDPITEQPEHEDAAALARNASLASQASSHRHSMPAMPTGYGNFQTHSGAPRHPEPAQPKLQSSAQQQKPRVTPPNPAQAPQPKARGMAPSNPAPPQQPTQDLPAHPNFQQQPAPGLYPHPSMPVPAGPSTGAPPVAQIQEKGKSKWLSRLLKSSRPSSKPSQQQQQQQQQHVWHGPLVIPPSQSPAPGAPWSPGSVGATLAPAGWSQPRGSVFPPPGAPPQMQQGLPQGFQPINAGPMHQRQGSGGVQMVPPNMGQPQKPGPAPAPANAKSVPPQAPHMNQGPPVPQPVGPVPTNLAVQSAPPAQSKPTAAPQPTQNTTSKGSPPNAEQAQSPTDAGPARTESVRSDFTTISTSEAQAQPVLKPQIVEVSRPSSFQRTSQPQSLPQNNGYASFSAAPQIRYEPPQGALDLGPDGQPPVQKHDSLRVAPLHFQKRLSAEGGDGSSVRESLISEVSSADSADSRRVSVLSTGPATPRKKVVKAGDYSGGGWGDDL